ncbi:MULTISPECIES: glutathione S-transferase family protein [Deefgea]|uniref:Glutathione S-transferase family protein n=1 Tax=Deefgea chitinilytica TaxID=570276 RepID=A0ABS2CET7_9NEIS|nr:MULTISPECIES: glutathione S-transferase family protein [Deefgea]MBM5572642.1 glutathione S-transferase family protein [Deefgea chitinilytica]MBM9889878.1 glutathione S-transferase family protein [Deefgea sp. CFH1-16]
MLTLNVFGAAFGLPDLSPFVTKTLVLLKMSGLPFETRRQGIKGAPKGKLPWLQDGEQAIADSTFIRLHLEQQHGCDFSGGYDAGQLALGWTVEKMLEEHLYWLGVYARWADDYNFNTTTSKLFNRIPWPMRALARNHFRKKMLAALKAQGMGRHSDAERAVFAQRDLAALAALLGDKPFLLGDTPCGYDASVYAFVNTALNPAFTSSLRTAAESHETLKAYVARMHALYFPAVE